MGSGRLAEVAENPFWSANVTPHSRAARSGSAQPDPVVCNGSTFAQVTSLASSCVQLMSHTLDMSPQAPIADSELTTIRMETKEQRLQWRDFLSDSVSQTRATSLFNSYDVEASPGYYARPPLSCTRADDEMKSWHGSTVGPHVVAPTGPTCVTKRHSTSLLSLATWVYLPDCLDVFFSEPCSMGRSARQYWCSRCFQISLSDALTCVSVVFFEHVFEIPFVEN